MTSSFLVSTFLSTLLTVYCVYIVAGAICCICQEIYTTASAQLQQLYYCFPQSIMVIVISCNVIHVSTQCDWVDTVSETDESETNEIFTSKLRDPQITT